MSERTIVVVSLLYVGGLVVLSRSWLGDVRAFVQRATGKPVTAAPSGPAKSGVQLAAFRTPDESAGPILSDSERNVVVEFIVGYAVLWLALTALTESDATAPVGAALAVAIASSASVLFLADAIGNLGLAGDTGAPSLVALAKQSAGGA